MEVFVWIDVHKESFHVTAICEGEEVFHGGMPSRYEILKKVLDRFEGCRVKVAYETGPSGFWLYYRLTADGIDTIVVPPSLIPVESGSRVKTDKRDNRKLARLLESGLLKEVHVLTEEERADRELLRTRRQLLHHRADVARQVKSELLFHGIEVPFSESPYWSGEFREWVRGFPAKHETLRKSFDPLITLYEELTIQIREITREVVALPLTESSSDQVKLLKTVPGIGPVTAMEILVEIPRIERFRTHEEIASYLGLTPSEHSTGEHIRHGRITRCGNKHVRTALVEVSWKLIKKDPLMREKYEKIKYRRGAKRAIIAVARMLSARIQTILLGNGAYSYTARRLRRVS
jgi:transposase